MMMLLGDECAEELRRLRERVQALERLLVVSPGVRRPRAEALRLSDDAWTVVADYAGPGPLPRVCGRLWSLGGVCLRAPPQQEQAGACAPLGGRHLRMRVDRPATTLLLSGGPPLHPGVA